MDSKSSYGRDVTYAQASVYKLFRRMVKTEAADMIPRSSAFREQETCKTCSIKARGEAVD
jgi:hypothetical protein